jgi:hypothetical protein
LRKLVLELEASQLTCLSRQYWVSRSTFNSHAAKGSAHPDS